jgi:putative endonuclease
MFRIIDYSELGKRLINVEPLPDSSAAYIKRKVPEGVLTVWNTYENWTVYLLLCADGTYYCGITNDLEKRVEKHNAGKGAKYTRGRLPVKVLISRDEFTKSEALKFERYVKSLPKKKKIAALTQS